MYKMMIVEDEPWIRRGLEKAIPWEELCIQYVGHARNGVEALQVFETYKPDLVLTDIKMPKMDGLAMIEKIIELSDHTPKFIIISGYNDFEYAKRAIKYGVVDYILKPIDPNELKASIIHIISKIRDEKREKRKHTALKLRSYIFEQITHGEHETEEEFIFPFDYFGMLFSFYPLPDDIVREEEHIYLVQLDAQYLYMIGGESLEHVQGILESCQESLPAEHQGISQVCHRNSRSVYEAFREAILSYQQSSHRESTGIAKTSISVKEEAEFIHMIQTGDQQMVVHYMNQLLIPYSTFQQQWSFYFQLIILIGKYFHIPSSLLKSDSWFSDFKALRSLDELILWKNQVFLPILNYIVMQFHTTKLDYSQLAKAFLEEHYRDSSLSLDQVADHLGISPAYLSLSFKKSVGINFTNYVTKIRIEAAKQMLLQTQSNLQEISREVGFNDVKYFMKVFKKETLLTPNRFRELGRMNV
ncbi:response regulator [Brevibacillus massiliensis]|uniref:response regulator n=1 Tax=Brevibacillus massiliensis TaxID=1118054 RepID=UPI000378439E|nr:response regulator [Brevibacillus massiliensis]